MNCPRCSATMVREFFQDLKDDTGSLSFYGCRCINCGEVVDPVIISNRASRPHLQARNRKLMSASSTGR